MTDFFDKLSGWERFLHLVLVAFLVVLVLLQVLLLNDRTRRELSTAERLEGIPCQELLLSDNDGR